MLAYHKRIVNARAEAVSAVTNGQTRVSKAIGPTAIAALDSEFWGAEPETDGLLDLAGLDEPLDDLEGVLGVFDVDEGVTGAELDELDGPDPDAEVELSVVVESKVGAATAVEGSTSAPFPHRTGFF